MAMFHELRRRENVIEKDEKKGEWNVYRDSLGHKYDDLKDINFGKLYDKDGNEYEGEYWVSFDEKFHNFHLAPYSERDQNVLSNISNIFGKMKEINEGNLKYTSGGGNFPDWTKQHKYKFCESEGGWTYLIGFQTLTFDDSSKEVNCYLDRIQFMRFKTTPGNINFGTYGKTFKMMYPKFSNEEITATYDKVTGHCVVNTPLIVEDEEGMTNEEKNAIAEAFDGFIKCFEGADCPETETIKGKLESLWENSGLKLVLEPRESQALREQLPQKHKK